MFNAYYDYYNLKNGMLKPSKIKQDILTWVGNFINRAARSDMEAEKIT